MAGGRPSKYYTNVQPKLELIRGWCRNGLTMEDIAHNLNVAVGTLYEYKKEFEEFNEILKNSREEADLQVENALFNNAMSGNITAQIFWLKNRKPSYWRDKREVETSGETTINNKVDLKAVSTEDLKKLLEVE